MNRFFVKKEDIGAAAIITGDDHKHLSRVLRLGAGDEVTLCDGDGTDYTARIIAVNKESTELQIIDSAPSDTESDIEVTLFQGLPKAGKLETIIQKCVELGVYAITPVLMERSVVKVTEKEFLPRLIRYNRVAYEAAKQSRRGRIPGVKNISRLAEIDWSGFDLVIAAYEDERDTPLKSVLRAAANTKRIALIIGPEGGFEQDEIERIKAAGGVSASLGRRILRTETAGMTALANILYELEDRA